MAYHQSNSLLLEFLKRLSDDADINVVRFDEILCSEQICATELDGTFVYGNGGHFSYEGSRLVAERMQLTEIGRASCRERV